MERSKTASRISWITLVANLILTILKAIIGITTGSLVVLSDAAHSASDAFSTVLVLLGIHIAKQPPDEKHPYGHGRARNHSYKDHCTDANRCWLKFCLYGI